jgi:phosphoglycolate phosphatase
MDFLIFDLDGTLIDSKLDLAQAVNATRVNLGLEPLENDRVYSYVGNGAPVLIRKALGPDYSEDEVQKALEYFLAFYREHMLDYTVLYPGMRECLDRLRDEGVLMAVLTNKPVRFSTLILEGLGVANCFFRIYGGNSFEQKKPHPMGVEKLLAESGVPKEQTLMVGDSSVDIRTARNAGIRVCGVTYGFQPETLSEDPPDMLLDRPEQLAELVIAERGAKGGVRK